ncbi:hypothetical protein PSHT_05323 [Puccinia striiformis]|uniref:Uncharacterized protein n=1 Tax=Puccinia striiformis TaxID=27350 RepID=A0A2S4WAN6_9BASI|nr:hypothetical protein PSHT_05323 [Puccinia striiformis]
MSTRKTTQDNTGTTPSISDVAGIVPVADDITPTGSQAAPKDITAMQLYAQPRQKNQSQQRAERQKLDGGSTGDLDQTEHVPVPDTLDVNTSCLDGMRDIPSSDDEDVVIGKLTHKSTDNSTSINKESMSSETHKFLWKLAMDADLKGDAAMANKLFQMTRNSTEESPVGKQGSNPKRGLDITALPKPLTAVLNTRAPFIDEFCLASDTESSGLKHAPDHYQQSNSSYGNNSSGGMNNNDNTYLDQNYLPGNSNSRSFHRNESSDSRPTRGGRNGFKGGFRGNGKAKAKLLDHQNQ